MNTNHTTPDHHNRSIQVAVIMSIEYGIHSLQFKKKANIIKQYQNIKSVAVRY